MPKKLLIAGFEAVLVAGVVVEDAGVLDVLLYSVYQWHCKRANEIAEQFGYDGAEDLKEAYVFGSGTNFNMMIDTDTGEIILESISDSSIHVSTGLFTK